MLRLDHDRNEARLDEVKGEQAGAAADVEHRPGRWKAAQCRHDASGPMAEPEGGLLQLVAAGMATLGIGDVVDVGRHPQPGLGLDEVRRQRGEIHDFLLRRPDPRAPPDRRHAGAGEHQRQRDHLGRHEGEGHPGQGVVGYQEQHGGRSEKSGDPRHRDRQRRPPCHEEEHGDQPRQGHGTPHGNDRHHRCLRRHTGAEHEVDEGRPRSTSRATPRPAPRQGRGRRPGS